MTKEELKKMLENYNEIDSRIANKRRDILLQERTKNNLIKQISLRVKEIEDISSKNKISDPTGNAVIKLEKDRDECNEIINKLKEEIIEEQKDKYLINKMLKCLTPDEKDIIIYRYAQKLEMPKIIVYFYNHKMAERTLEDRLSSAVKKLLNALK